MKRSGKVVLGATVAAATILCCAGLFAADGSDDTRVCVTEQLDRMEDKRCEDDGDDSTGHYRWYYIPSNHYVPPHGGKAYGGTYSKPGGFSSFVRGGFGGKSGGGS